MRDAQAVTVAGGLREFDGPTFIGRHENAAVRAIRRAQAAADAVVFDDDLLMPATMDGVHRAAGHAVRRLAGAAGRRYDEISKTRPVAEQPGDRHAVRFAAVLLHAAPGAFVAPRAEIHVEHEDAPGLVESLLDVLMQEGIEVAGTPQSGQGGLDDPLPQRGEVADHCEEVGAIQARQFHVFQSRAGGGAEAGWDRPGQIGRRAIERRFEGSIHLVHTFTRVVRRDRQQGDLPEDGTGRTTDHVRLTAEPPHPDADATDPQQIETVRDITLPKDGLARADTQEGESRAEEFDEPRVLLGVDALEQFHAGQDDIQRALAIEALEFSPLARQPHQTIEHIAANLPNLPVVQSHDVGGSRRTAQAGHLAHDHIRGRPLCAKQDLLSSAPQAPAAGLRCGGKDGDFESAAADDERRIARIALPAKHVTRLESPTHREPLLPEEELRRHAREERIAGDLRGGQHFGSPLSARDLHLCHGFESDRTGRAGDHAFAALHAARFRHRIVQIKTDARARTLARPSDDVVPLHFIAGPDAAVAKNACAVIDEEDGRRIIDLPLLR